MIDPRKRNTARDLSVYRRRVFFGNLAECTREELAEICMPYGNVVGGVVERNLGYIQFDTEETAINAAAALMNTIFKGRVMTVRHICLKNTPSVYETIARGTTGQNGGGNEAAGKVPFVCNECEIIVVDRKNTEYAEMIEQNLLHLGIRIDILYPNQNVTLGKVLSSIAERGCLYAILITNQHEEHNSVTLNILHGRPAEHRNMAVSDAIQMITNDYYTKILKRENTAENPAAIKDPSIPNETAENAYILQSQINNYVESVTTPTKSDKKCYVPPLKERHPSIIQSLLNSLAKNEPLTIAQYDLVIKYLSNRRSLQEKIELGNHYQVSQTLDMDPNIKKQKQLLRALYKRLSKSRHTRPAYTNLTAVRADRCLMGLLHDGDVQRTLGILMRTSTGIYVENIIKLHRWIRH